MNYYIQGNKEKADQIKAAFEKFGYDVETWRFTTGVYYTLNGRIVNTNIGSNEHELILNNPDYKELPIGPMFKVGDWVVKKDGGTFYGGNYAEQITLIEVDEKGKRIWLSSTTYVHDDDIRLWTIQDAKDGDVLAFDWTQDDGASHWEKIVVFKKYHAKGVKGLFNSPCVEGYGNTFKNGKLALQEEVPYYSKTWTMTLQPATREQRDLLFAKMKEAGYEWDADKKELRKIKPHYDISNFKPFQKVLVRQDDSCTWGASFFGRYAGMFMCCNNACFIQCIPYNDDTMHLLGTTEPCDEQYINW